MLVAQLDRVSASEAGSRKFESCRARHFLCRPVSMIFLDNLPKPFTALAPMEGVTNSPFRQVLLDCGRPDLFFTEFVSVDGLFSVGQAAVAHRLKYTPQEKPLIAQVWGKDPEKFFKAAKYMAEAGFDGVDINMGCPVNKVIKNGCCSALIEDPPLAKEIFCATREGATQLSVSIKTRIGLRKRITEEWGAFLLQLKPDLLTIHGRTAKDMYKVPADWDEIGKVVQLRNDMHSKTLIIGNGDVVDYGDILKKAELYGVDGVMVGRGILRNLFIFNAEGGDHSAQERVKLLKRHLHFFQETWGDSARFSTLKKYFKVYISAIPAAPRLRNELMQTETIAEVLTILEKWQFD